MKKTWRAVLVTATAVPGIAFSEGFSTADLGSTNDDPECLERGHQMFDKLAAQHSVGQVSTGVSNWSVIAFDLT